MESPYRDTVTLFKHYSHTFLNVWLTRMVYKQFMGAQSLPSAKPKSSGGFACMPICPSHSTLTHLQYKCFFLMLRTMHCFLVYFQNGSTSALR